MLCFNIPKPCWPAREWSVRVYLSWAAVHHPHHRIATLHTPTSSYPVIPPRTLHSTPHTFPTQTSSWVSHNRFPTVVWWERHSAGARGRQEVLTRSILAAFHLLRGGRSLSARCLIKNTDACIYARPPPPGDRWPAPPPLPPPQMGCGSYPKYPRCSSIRWCRPPRPWPPTTGPG